ncbi:hypothetical protein T07_12387, partial [Trichinella nelsoni]
LIMQIFGRSPCVFSSLHLVFRKAMTHNYPKRNFYFSNAFATPPAQLLLSLLTLCRFSPNCEAFNS